MHLVFLGIKRGTSRLLFIIIYFLDFVGNYLKVMLSVHQKKLKVYMCLQQVVVVKDYDVKISQYADDTIV